MKIKCFGCDALSPRVSTVAADGSQPPAARQKRGDAGVAEFVDRLIAGE